MFLKHPISTYKRIIHMWPLVKEIMENDWTSRKWEENLLRDGIFRESRTLQCENEFLPPVELQQSLMKIRGRFLPEFSANSRSYFKGHNDWHCEKHDSIIARLLLHQKSLRQLFILLCGFYYLLLLSVLLNGHFICMMCHRFMFRCLFKNRNEKKSYHPKDKTKDSRAIH